MSKIIGVTVGTPLSPSEIEGTLNPVKTVNGKAPDENGNVDIKIPEGSTGKDGASAYEVALANGFEGSEQAWLASLKGADYVLTEADKTEIVRMTIESLGGNPVFGYVDENNNIIVSGNLADGSYTIKYEMEDGSIIDIGELTLDNNVYFVVTNTLTNCANNNSTTQVIKGQSYVAVISANSGYELSSVSVTMGGTSIPVSGGNISIEEVTGDIVITAVAKEAVVEIVNLIPTSVDTDGTIYNGIGYKTNTRIRGTGATEAYNGASCTGFIKANTGDMVYIKGITSNTAGLSKVHCYNASKTSINAIGFSELTNEGNGVYSCTITLENTEYIRVASAHIMDGSEIVTVNRSIV